jgi:CBS domain containing-hemolysin-like protein
MVPRPDVVAIEVTASIEDALDVAVEAGHRRLPVYEGSLEIVVGIVGLRDLVQRRHT